jgi:hypothetical protein
LIEGHSKEYILLGVVMMVNEFMQEDYGFALSADSCEVGGIGVC